MYHGLFLGKFRVQDRRGHIHRTLHARLHAPAESRPAAVRLGGKKGMLLSPPKSYFRRADFAKNHVNKKKL
jgi:hypothetical protein